MKKYLQEKGLWIYRNIYYRLKPRAFYWSPRIIASMWYAYNRGKLPNFRYPKTVEELWMSINLRSMKDKCARDMRIRCADKYAVRRYVEEKGFADTLNDCYGVYDSFDKIDFNKLPNQFVLKMTNGSGMNFICKDKSRLDLEELRHTVATWYEKSKDFGLKTAEWHYVR